MVEKCFFVKENVGHHQGVTKSRLALATFLRQHFGAESFIGFVWCPLGSRVDRFNAILKANELCRTCLRVAAN